MREDAIEVLGSGHDSAEESEETSFSSPRGSQPLLGTDWAHKPSIAPAPKPRRRGRRSIVSPSESPSPMSPTQPLSPIIWQRSQPTSPAKTPPSPKPRRKSRGVVSPSESLSSSNTPERSTSPARVATPIQHVFAEVHISPQPSPSNKNKDTVIEIFETEEKPKEKSKLPPLKPRTKKFTSKNTKEESPIQKSVEIRTLEAGFESPITSENSSDVLDARTQPRVSSAKKSISKSSRPSSSQVSAKKKKESKKVPPGGTTEVQDFFVQSWREDSPEEEVPASPSADTMLETGSPEHARFTLEEYFGPSRAQIIEYVDPVKMPPQPSENLFFPSSKPVPLEAKLGPGLNPRFRDEEGIYVGTRPEIPWSVRNKMEQRILAASKSSKQWFGEDGEIVSVEDAIRDKPLRPRSFEEQEQEPLFITYFKDAEVYDGVVSGTPLLLELALCSLHFTHHPLFSREHVVAQQLVELHRVHAQRVSAGKTERLAGRLRALRHARDMLVQQGRGDDRLTRCCQEIREVRGTLLTEGAHGRSLLAALLGVWKELRELRTSQGFTCSPLRLVITQKSTDEAQETQEWQKELEVMVEEMLQEQSGDEEARSEREVCQLATQLLTEGRRPPGEPRVKLELRHDLEISREASNSKERQRRALVRRYKLHLLVCYNGQEVCRTPTCTLQEQFSVVVNQIVPLSVTQWPQAVTVQLREETTPVTSNLLAQVTVPLPARGVTLTASTEEKLEFSGEISGSCEHNPCALFPTCVLKCRVGWGQDADGSILEPPDKYWAAMERKRPALTHLKSPEQLQRWVDKAKLDPNDPNNAAVFNMIKGGVEEGLDDTEEADQAFYPQEDDGEDWVESTRLKVLQLRSRGEPEFCNLKMVPANERELPPGILKEYEERQLQPRDGEGEESSHPEASLNAQRAWGRKNLRRIRELVQQQSRLASKRRTLRDLVTEDLVPDIGTLGLTFMQWLQPSRPLRPLRKPRKTIASLPGLGRDAVLIVNIVSAFQVPVRRELDLTTTGRSSVGSSVGSPTFQTVAVRPFVEVNFQGEVSRTAAADGANPTWNQELQLPVKAGCTGRERITLAMFDEVTLDVLEDERLRGVDTHTRQERAWLGNISFPFSALQLTSRIDGTFPLVSPPLLGYEREGQLRQFSGTGVGLDSPPSPRRDDSSAATFLTMFITIQPALQPPEQLQERLESNESPAMEQHLELWEIELTSLFPDRKVQAMVPDSQGRSVCMTRFFRPLPPPVCGDEGKSGRLPADQAARYISLISVADPGNGPDIWLTAEQVLGLSVGDLMPRAVLLTCYLQHLSLRAWLMIGWGLGTGPGGFVLSRGCRQAGQGGHEEDLWVWDVNTGRRTTLDDPFCPVTLVWALVNQDNIWANIQRDANPRRMRFDVARSADWLPAFPPGGTILAPDILCCMQPEILRYTRTNEEACLDLAERLERVLKDNFMSWRPSMRTRWNRHCSAVLRRILPSLEYCLGRPEQLRELQPLLGAHKMLGFPLQMGFSDEGAVVRALYATQLHASHDPDIEFSLAVHVHPLPSQVVCIWIYIASLVRRR